MMLSATTIIYIISAFLFGLLTSTILFIYKRQNMLSSFASLETQLQQYKDMAESLEQENKEIVSQLQTTREELIKQEAIIKQHQHIKKAEEILINKFENISNKIFEEKNQKFKMQSQESLDAMLRPLREKISDFEKKITDSFGNQAKEHFSLKEQIKNIVEINEKMTLQAQELANALKGDSKKQGDWGEIMLEKILEDSGLRKGDDYILQASGLKLRNEDNKLQKPDVIINLPENKHIIIDSKVSLTHYERYFSENDENIRPIHLKKFLLSIKKHIEDLEKRRYQDTEKLGTPDFVLMFIPIEAAYILALQENKEIQNYAWNKKVVIVCPSTLFATLRTIASVWRLELQNKNAQEIAKQGGLLYDKIEGFIKDMQDLGKQLDTTSKTYHNAMNKLSSGKGNILSKTEKLKELGAKTSKSIMIKG